MFMPLMMSPIAFMPVCPFQAGRHSGCGSRLRRRSGGGQRAASCRRDPGATLHADSAAPHPDGQAGDGFDPGDIQRRRVTRRDRVVVSPTPAMPEYPRQDSLLPLPLHWRRTTHGFSVESRQDVVTFFGYFRGLGVALSRRRRPSWR